MAGVGVLLAVVIAVLTLLVGAADQLLDARRPLASLAALGVDRATLERVLRRQQSAGRRTSGPRHGCCVHDSPRCWTPRTSGSLDGHPGGGPLTAVHLPADPTGVHLAVVVHDLTHALRKGDIVIDASAVAQRSPGLQVVPRYCRRRAAIRGNTWTDI